MLATKLIEKKILILVTLRNITILIRKEENTKLVKQSKIIIQQLKAIENPNTFYIKSVIIEHPKTSHKLSKTIRQAENIFQVASGKSSNSLFDSE